MPKQGYLKTRLTNFITGLPCVTAVQSPHTQQHLVHSCVHHVGTRRGSHFCSYWRSSKLRPTWYGMVNETFVHIRCTMNMHSIINLKYCLCDYHMLESFIKGLMTKAGWIAHKQARLQQIRNQLMQVHSWAPHQFTNLVPRTSSLLLFSLQNTEKELLNADQRATNGDGLGMRLAVQCSLFASLMMPCAMFIG